MQVILKEDIENLGLTLDIVDVKPGYARNYLIPRGVAALATPKNRAKLAEIIEHRKEEDAKLIKEANEKIEKLKTITLNITAKAGTGDKLFGSINNSNLAEELAKQGLDIDKKYIKIPGNTIKRLGNYSAKVRLHRDVEFDYDFAVVPEATEAPAKAKAEDNNTAEEA
ncbi:MAG: 50S ribosomal protein L9 [Chryseobacterium sp.]|nr:MAG: 50S ribosomal protein L9 [Chryseobacterium sp.]